MTPVTLGAQPTSIEDIAAIAAGSQVVLDSDMLAAMTRIRDLIQQELDSGQAIYGLTTGVGDLYSVKLRPDEISRSQLNMLRSHASGVGAPHDHLAIRAIMATMIRALLQGCSGVSPDLVLTMTEMLNRGVTPWSPSGGSVGYLIATAHIGLAVFGQGQAWYRGQLLPGGEALAQAGIAVREPGPREGHALLSGTYEITGIGALALDQVERLVELADVAGAMSLEALKGNTKGYDPRLQRMRPHAGQVATAARLLSVLDASQIIAANADHRLQDALSLRCIPQVHGAVRDAIAYCRGVLEVEINSVTDNPVFVVENDTLVALPGGNGHGAPTALALDCLAVAISQLGSMSQARSDRLTNSYLSGLPAFLADGRGSNSGFMIPPYVAAALAADNRSLAAPASVHSVSTCAGQEDHVSMGVTAACKARTAANNTVDILSVEFICAAQALEFQRPLRPGRGTGAAYDLIRTQVPARDADRDMYPELRAIRDMIDDGRLARAIENAIAPDHRGPRT
ncbi:histidine ammonia-lyase [Pseudomonas gingeri NCPPB 3146 = LMG 5327]|uniref:Aromatic amino acid lyase n=2 Tax=Pseudomonas gingeri TaxID=117681 RepID=A0A7Y7XUT2_9PSED|nr:aromatic amino acid lyase [Pseudomonas gingeri]NWA08770.1 aromatic amino acid lyase [Pseudomonas gingeri]NWC12722.1 aromatic amino acid lyase [Pseudomonas gingeri]NWE49485.1 aromatic amino acid lyase [Pseudomonas gingeri]NWE72989.1 aromatic amino acid lyase [Pseudomonas gingeri]PNQ93001.1 histidine ammonia-lyase [Pseudomonas gingeri NCPPB 3146 = LMG 5327]